MAQSLRYSEETAANREERMHNGHIARGIGAGGLRFQRGRGR
jgi:hypothetical protein